MTKALARHGSGAAWLLVHENGAGKGGHCHLLAHVPAGFVEMLTGLQKGIRPLGSRTLCKTEWQHSRLLIEVKPDTAGGPEG